MSREVRRVPLDFDWPLNKVWQGYLSPAALHGEPCPHCNGGETWAARWLYLFCHQINMLAGDVRDQEQGRPLHPWLATNPHPPITWRPDPEKKRAFVSDDYDVMRPSADIVPLLAAIAGCEPREVGGLFGRNTEYDLYQAIVKTSGLDSWGVCTHCDGHGATERYEGQRAERDAWEPSGPPSGDGWQLWETVSEGSPVSPVFAASGGLAVWMSTVYRPVGGGRLTLAQAETFIGVGFSMGSGVITGTGEVLANERTVATESGARR